MGWGVPGLTWYSVSPCRDRTCTSSRVISICSPPTLSASYAAIASASSLTAMLIMIPLTSTGVPCRGIRRVSVSIRVIWCGVYNMVFVRSWGRDRAGLGMGWG